MRRLAMVLLAVGGAGCVRHVPAVDAPEPAAMQARAPKVPPAPGTGRVLIGTTTDPSLVEERTGQLEALDGQVEGPTYRKLCKTTPCSADLAYGVHALRFTSLVRPLAGGEGDITVGAEPSAYRYALGHKTEHLAAQVAGAIAFMMGAPLLIFGVAFAVAGLQPNSVTKQYPYPEALPLGVAAAGAALITVACLLLGFFPSEVQNGAGTQWTL